jgi:carbonic anhydrase
MLQAFYGKVRRLFSNHYFAFVMSIRLEELFANNREWAAQTQSLKPGFFTQLTQQQKPRYMWIGCADSRVPANELVNLLPGELFVHRNVANLVVHSDLNALSVLQYAVDVLGVLHVIVVGHSGCGGIQAALSNQRSGLVDNWLRHVQDVRDTHEAFLQMVAPAQREAALVELNVLEQARNVCRTTVVQDAWQRGQSVTVHGWVYGLHNGLLTDLHITASGWGEVPASYETALTQLKQRWAANP